MRLRSSTARSVFCAVILTPLSAAATSTSGEAGGTLTGYSEVTSIAYRASGTPDAEVWGRTRLSWENRLSPHLFFRVVGVVDADARGQIARGPIYDGDDRDLKRAPVRLEDLSIAWSRSHFDITAGRMILPWGRADGFNPTDNLTPYDTLDPLEENRLSSWAIRGRHYAGRTTVEWDVLPYPGVTRLPLLGGRWLPVPTQAGNPVSGGPATVKLDWRDGDATYPKRTAENAAWAIKIDHRAASWEGSLSHYDGWDDEPVLIPRPGVPRGSAGAVPIALDRAQPGLRSTGGDFAWIRGRFALRAEAARDERGAPAAGSFDFYMLEGEWTTGDWRLIAGWADIRGIDASATTASIFDQGALPAAIIHIERSVPTGTGASIQIISNLDGEGEVVRGEISWPLGRSWRATAGIDLIDGSDGTFLGAYRRNDRAVFKVRWSFAGGAIAEAGG